MSEEKGFKKTETFLAAAALLAAVLLVWVQFWDSADAEDINRWFAIPWLYVAVLLDIAALAFTGYRQLTSKNGVEVVPSTAMGLLVAAFEMMALQVLQSFASNTLVLLDRICADFTYRVTGLEGWSTGVAAVLTAGMVVSAVVGVRRLAGSPTAPRRAPLLVNLACVFALSFLVLSLMLFGEFRAVSTVVLADIWGHVVLSAALIAVWIAVARKTRKC